MWKVWLVLGLAAVGLYFTVLPMFSRGTDIGYSTVGAAAVAAMVVGILVHRPVRVLPWWLLAGGLALWVVGDFIYTTALERLGADMPYPSAADPFFMLAYPVFGAGLALAGGRRRGGGLGAMVEVAIIVFSASLASWVLLMRPYLDDPSASLLSKVEIA